jgi:hypothetical protein
MSVSSSFVAKSREYRKEAFKKIRNEEIKVLEENLRTPLENIDYQINQKLISKSSDESILWAPIISRGKLKNTSAKLLTNNANEDKGKNSLKRQLSTTSLPNETKNVNIEPEIEEIKAQFIDKKTLAEKTNENQLKKIVNEMIGKCDKYIHSQKEMKEKPKKNSNTDRLIRNNEPIYVRYYQELAKKEYNVENIRQKVLEEKISKLNNFISNCSNKNRSYRDHESNLNKTQIIENFQLRNELWIKRKEENLQMMNEMKQNNEAMTNFPFKPKLNTNKFSNDNEPFLEKLRRTSSERLINKKKLVKKHTPSFKPKLNPSYSYISCNKSFTSSETMKSTGFKSTLNKSLKLTKNNSNLTKISKGGFDSSLKKKGSNNKQESCFQNLNNSNKMTNDSNDLYKINYRNDLSHIKQPRVNNIIFDKKHKEVFNVLKKNKFIKFDNTSTKAAKRLSLHNSIPEK